MPEPVLAITVVEETTVAAFAAAPHAAPVRNEQLLQACWHARHDLPSVRPPLSTPPNGPWVHAHTATSRRLIVLCGPTVESSRYHPLVMPHAHLLVSATTLSDEECARRGGCDSYAELWTALEAGMPLVLLQTSTSLTTRRARKQLLHRLSKQPAAAAYAWEALAGAELGGSDIKPAGGKEAAPPTVEEGWAAVL